MTTEILKKLFTRDLNKLKEEIAAYNNEEKLWYIEGNIANSAGNLCLHLVGNLSAFIGAELGKSGYIRNRPDEFALKNVPRAELIDKIEKTIVVVGETLDKITQEQLDAVYPIEVLGQNLDTGYFLMHLAMHLSYHLGQVNYHRRLLDE
ncbi:DinB family protein [Mucilaginibacter flavus]|uniref:DinB family protein n=1 Tax=Mucilaginibacter flavus TaxID=931504 RepID=UPI0025B437C2|nr:DUF1572 family protein [Mucilaginibacter flavus]MDN3584522.1 DUF1572 family protein [Mucilaginibacter flavus]